MSQIKYPPEMEIEREGGREKMRLRDRKRENGTEGASMKTDVNVKDVGVCVCACAYVCMYVEGGSARMKGRNM